MNPYDILNISSDATDATVRKSYLEGVKKFPPDLAPEQFKKINNAYSQVKNEKSRLEYYLFNTESYGNSPTEALLNYFREKGERKPLNYSLMKKYLSDCKE
ncbi:MAG: J domain-containing protein [Candidatus Anammoxibacter sp.]